MKSDLLEIIYVSAAAPDFKNADLPKILEISRQLNAEVEVTGVLLHTEGSFIQVLEGPRPAVETKFARIEQDPRHTHVAVLKRGSIETRRFAEWSMGYSDLSVKRPRELEGFTDFLRTGRIKPGDAKAQSVLGLLERFRRGRYRQAG